jgi:hypothetical protein
MTTSVQLVRNAPAQRRVERRPAHNWWVKHRPYQIQPIAIAPVIPGETLQRALFQCRAKTDALAANNSMLGWWLEHYWFYIKLTDLEGRDDFRSMLLQYGHDISAYDAAANVKTFHAGPGIDWTKLCLDRVVEEYFRNEGDGTVTFDGLPQASLNQESFLDSAKLASATSDQDHELPGENPLVPDEMQTAFSQHFAQWEHMRALGLTEATYESWLRAYGVTPPPDERESEEDFHPELLRYSRDFQYPSTVVDGATGSSTSAVVWSVAERLDKRRFFREPGFILGVTVARPKVYLANQRGTGASMLNDAYAWLPAVLRDHPFTSLKQFDNDPADGPLGATPSEAYWIDIRDLLIYGDQFVNFDLSSTPAGTVALPTSGMQRRFASETNIDAMFGNAAGGFKYIQQEGRIALDILGNQKDTT